MSLTAALSIQSSFRKFCSTKHWNLPLELTFTMKQSLSGPFRRLDSIRASQNLRHFLNVLNSRVFGNAHKRFGKGVRVVAVLEGTSTKRLHYHLIIDCPPGFDPMNLQCLVTECWQKTEWADQRTYVTVSNANTSDGFLVYMSKLRDKESYSDSIDWENTRL
jgi:hypothetical protein